MAAAGGAVKRPAAAMDPSSHSSKAAEEEFDIGDCKPASQYERIGEIGSGTYGKVYKAQSRVSRDLMVAMKRVYLHHGDEHGFPITSLREIESLRALTHPNIVRLLDIAVGKTRKDVFLIFEYCHNDLACIIDKSSRHFKEEEIKCLMFQLLEGVAFCHDRFIMHRDLKMSNLLYHQGVLKIADFGLARRFGCPDGRYTPNVVTLWYRAPEVLFGMQYTKAIDIWAAGCIFAEFIQRKPLFQTDSETGLLQAMKGLLGPVPEDMCFACSDDELRAVIAPSRDELRHSDSAIRLLRRKFSQQSDTTIDLLHRMLQYDPEQRITAHEALRHAYFSEFPKAVPVSSMPTFAEAIGSLTGGVAGQGGQRDLSSAAHTRRPPAAVHAPSRSRPVSLVPPKGVVPGLAGGASAPDPPPSQRRRRD